MAQEPQQYGVLTSLDLIKQGNSHGIYNSKRQYEAGAERSSDPHSIIAGYKETLSIRADPKRPRLDWEDSIQASEICHAPNDIEYLRISEYSQRRAASSTPSASLNPLLRLSHPAYGLPESLVKNFTSLGIDSIYPWQSSCLLGRGVLNGQTNLVYSAPTGGGKSLVADVVMLKRVLEDPKKKAILVLPVRDFGAFLFIFQLLGGGRLHAVEAAREGTFI
ncbi:MAG: hypothetical protein Q9195_001088 [Heterodermia aff. obscurata]